MLPVRHPVILRTSNSLEGKIHAQLWLMQRDGKRWYHVTIERNNLSVMKDSLCHEWAHILDWHDSSVSVVVRKRKEHTARWGAIYAKCYRLVFNTEN